MVLVILLQILTHKFKIYQTPPEDNIKEEKNDDPKYLFKTTWRNSKKIMKKAKEKIEKLIKELKLL
ncbi:hypothetical protein HYD54_02020 [Mycoplasmopsis bovis]|nr:hypothetical protein [Mycoplasmopsis bovis]QQH71843.1 hypothetical protein HYD54_02020 [Mycoplasmopsis bovis]